MYEPIIAGFFAALAEMSPYFNLLTLLTVTLLTAKLLARRACGLVSRVLR